jgi:hypothetical protein
VNPKKEVVFGEQSFSVRGLNVTDVTTLALSHASAIEQVFEAFSNGTPVVEHLSTFPELVAEVIALAALEKGDDIEVLKGVARELPLTTQIEALTAIGELTFTSVEALKKTLEMVTGLANKTASQIESLSKTGTRG